MTTTTTLRAQVEGLRARLEAEERQRLALTGRVLDLLATVEAMGSRLAAAAAVGSIDDAVDRGFAEFAAPARQLVSTSVDVGADRHHDNGNHPAKARP